MNAELIKWNDYMSGMRGLSILRRRKLSKISNWLSPSGVYIYSKDRSQAHREGGNMFLCLVLAPDLISVAWRWTPDLAIEHDVSSWPYSKTILHQFLPSDGVLVTCTYKQVPKLALSPPL